VDAPSVAPKARLFTLAEVFEHERHAWHEDTGDTYLYDGIMLWRCHDGRRRAVPPDLAPGEGWRHRAQCRCAACAASGGRSPS
jgi:hypothetical protein